MKFDNKKIKIYQIFKLGKFNIPNLNQGKSIPVITLNEINTNQFHQLVELHKNTSTGDITSIWGRPVSLFKPKFLKLSFYFSKHMDLSFAVTFDVKKDHKFIDALFQNECLLMNTSKDFHESSDIEKAYNSIMIDLPATDTKPKWEKLFFETIKDTLKSKNVNKKDINNLTRKKIEDIRGKWNNTTANNS